MEKEELIDYCPVCDEDTVHIPVVDEVFIYAVQCTECKIVWEAEDPTNYTVN